MVKKQRYSREKRLKLLAKFVYYPVRPESNIARNIKGAFKYIDNRNAIVGK